MNLEQIEKNTWNNIAYVVRGIEGVTNQLNKLNEYGYNSFGQFETMTGIKI